MIVTVYQFQKHNNCAIAIHCEDKWHLDENAAHPIAKKKSGRDMKLFFSINLPSVPFYFEYMYLLFHVPITYESSLSTSNTYKLYLFKYMS